MSFLGGLALLFLLLTVQVNVSQMPLKNLLDRAVNDDFFYYLQVARNASSGQGFSFDGIHRSNGFQPAWELILTGVATLVRTPEDLLRKSLILCAAMNFIAGLGLLRLSRALFPGRLAALPLIFWASVQLNPKLAMSGMETSLNWLLFVMMLNFLVSMNSGAAVPPESSRDPMNRNVVLLSLLCSGLVLVRLDNAIYVPLAWLAISRSTRQSRKGSEEGPLVGRDSLRALVIFVLPLLVVAFSYVAWNLSYFGLPLPISGLVKQRVSYEARVALLGGYLGPHWLGYWLIRSAEKLLWALAQSTAVITWGRPLYLASPVIVGVLSSLLLMPDLLKIMRSRVGSQRFAERNRSIDIVGHGLFLLIPFWVVYGVLNLVAFQPAKQGLKVVLLISTLCVATLRSVRFGSIVGSDRHRTSQLLVGVLSFLMIIHALLMVVLADYYLDYSSWYFATWFIVIALGLAQLYARSRIRSSAVVHSCVMALLAIGLIGTIYFSAIEPREPPPNTLSKAYEQALWIDKNLPYTATVGSYNAGVIGYFSNRRTINLDGLINGPELLYYLFGPGTMAEYVDIHCIDFVADYLEGSKQIEELSETAGEILRIDHRKLELMHSIRGYGWQGVPQQHVIFGLRRTAPCSPTLHLDLAGKARS